MPKRSPCPIVCALDLLGDRWTLVVLRDIVMFDQHRFGDMLERPEGISTNILTERLARLEDSGLIERRPYQDNPPRYEYHATKRGLDLVPVLKELALWAAKHVPGTPSVAQVRARLGR